MDTVFEDFRVGYGINALNLEITTGADTAEIFRSFACTQYSVDKKASKVRLYLWLEYYREGDCICVENDDVKCKPDTTTSNVTLTYSFLNNSIQCHISDVKTYSLGDKKFKQFIRHIEMKQFNNLRYIDEKLFIKKKKSKESILEPILFNYLKIADYCLKTNNEKVKLIVDDLISKNEYFIKENNNLKHYLYYLWYVNRLKDSILKFQNTTIVENGVFNFGKCLPRPSIDG
jgi:hypothetical protein